MIVFNPHTAQTSFKEKIAPADVLLYSSIIVAIPGLTLIIAGIALGLSSGGVSAHYSLTYVGLALFAASVGTGSVAIKRIVQTNRYLKQLGLTASEFISQWNAQDDLLCHSTSVETQLTDINHLDGNNAHANQFERLPMAPRMAVL